GRCADFVLKDRDDVLDVFVYASMDNRIERVTKMYGEQVKNVPAFINRYDKDRAAYYDYYTSKKWGDLRSYHLSLNSDMGIKNCVEIVKTAYKEWRDGVHLV
ncbi:MAG: cytidylate kinase-like family protein, partial [Mucispirillum sp.]|nr:cytidylate kinase-like family protein [Mucispirillum sp.]